MSIALVGRGQHVVTNPDGKAIDGVLLTDPNEAREKAAELLERSWEDLANDGYRVKMCEVWTV